MNRLMLMIRGGTLRYMAEAGGAGGGEGGGAGTPNAGTGDPGIGTGDPGTGTGDPGTGTPNAGTGDPGTGTPNAGTGDPGTGTPNAGTGTGGDGVKSAFGQQVDQTKTDDQTKPADPPKEFTDEDYTKAMTASEAVRKAAGDENVEIASEVFKGMLPTIRKAGITPEQANELANELALQQITSAKADFEKRMADIKTMNDEAMKIYPDKQSWDAIGAGVKHFFKPGGTMYQTIVHSELGSDPEFLAVMKYVGERVAKDGLGGAPGSGGEKPVSYEKALMG